MRYAGALVPPMRRRRILSMESFLSLGSESAAHPRGALHQLLHPEVLLQELVHLGYGGARAGGDPLLAAPVDQLRGLALAGRRRGDGGLEPLLRVVGDVESRVALH